MAKTLDLIFDFASPNAYLVHKALPPVLERSGASLNLIPCLLGGIFKSTGNQAPMLAFGAIKGKLEYEQLEFNRFVKKHAIDQFVFNSHFPVNTLLMMRAAIVAQNQGQLDAYVETGLHCMWEKGLKMDDPEVFISAMNEAGFDGSALAEGSTDPDVKAQLVANTAQAVDRGAFGIPTFFVGDEMFFGKERLPQVEEALSS